MGDLRETWSSQDVLTRTQCAEALPKAAFNAFFAKFGFKLALDYGPGRARRHVSDQTVVTPLADFCKQQVKC